MVPLCQAATGTIWPRVWFDSLLIVQDLGTGDCSCASFSPWLRGSSLGNALGMESSVPTGITVQWDIMFYSGLIQSVGCLMERKFSVLSVLQKP